MLGIKPPPIQVEYDCRGKRASKVFTDAYLARSFYAMKLKQNKNPQVKKVEATK